MRLDNERHSTTATQAPWRQHARARLLAVVATAAALLPCGAHAVYKCAGSGAAPIYQDEPCAPGKELRNFDTDPPTLSIVPGQPTGAAPRPGPSPAVRSATEPKSAKTERRPKPRGDPSARKYVRVGMSQAEVIAHLGAPDVTSGGKQKQGLRWTWLPAEGDPDTITTVTLVNGAVTGVERKVVKK